jgi:hypothetical protein
MARIEMLHEQKAIPVVAGSSATNSETASNPPAEAPIPTIGRGLSDNSICFVFSKAVSCRWNPAAPFDPESGNDPGNLPPSPWDRLPPGRQDSDAKPGCVRETAAVKGMCASHKTGGNQFVRGSSCSVPAPCEQFE